ncbi:MAG: PAS domain S-box protein [Candidatus Bathyarchaeota archaeon]|nr:PAS domain S-box protein [Candidatus Bathyarchaeota archaeon]
MANQIVPGGFGGLRVLLVDDDEAFLEISKQILQQENNYQIDTATSVNQATQKLKTKTFDVIVSDYEMPQKTGLDLLNHIKKTQPNTPFILFTGKGREDIAIQALNLGADYYINKHGTPKTVYGELTHAITNLVRARNDDSYLLTSEDENRLLFENSFDGVMLTKPDGSILSANPAACRMLRMSEQEIIKVGRQGIVVKDEKLKNALKEREQTGKVVSEFTFKRKDGSTFVGEASSNLFLSSSGEVKSCLIIRDITQRKKIEAALKKSEELQSAIVANSPIGIATIAADANFLSANESFVKILGYSESELRKMDFKDITHPDYLADSIIAVDNLNAGKVPFFSLEKKYIRKDGTIIDGKVNVSQIRDEKGKPRLYVISLEDVTSLKKDMLALSESEARFRQLIINSPDTIYLFDNISHKTQFLNRDTFLGYPRSEIEGTNSLTEHIYPADKEYVLKNWYDIMQGTISGEKPIEYRLKSKSGKWEWLQSRVNVLQRDGKGKPQLLLVSLSIVTERKFDEEKLFLFNEKIRVLGSLTRHDVGNKLMTIRNSVYLLRKHVGDDPRVTKYFEAIDSAVNSANRLFDFSRVYEKIGAEKPSVVDVGEAFDQAISLIPNLGKIKIINECHNLKVVADSLLVQVFHNLVDNTIKYGGFVSQIKFYFLENDNKKHLIYEDNGEGISFENKSKLFNEGFSTGGSTGLGLSLIKKIVEFYGWTIVEKGEPGEGAKFTLTINNN